MNKIEIKNTDEYIYHEELPNGLNVYLYTTKNTNEYAASFFTKYGSVYNDFKSSDDVDFKEYPKGIAHFLEHKLFESETESAMDYFANSGTFSNAYTSYFVTSYIIEGKEEYNKNINYLIDFVQSTYFTKENVEKEKGIIEQELKMYMDNPYKNIYETNIFNLIVNHPIRYDIGGTVEDVYKITKEMLDDCYSTFYSPNNMYLVITGNIDINETIKIIKENQSKKELKNIKYYLKEYEESNLVFKEHEELKCDIEVPLISLGIKIPYKNINKVKLDYYFKFIFFENFSNVSDFYLDSLKQKKVLSAFNISHTTLDNFVVLFILGESNVPDELLDDIKIKLKDLKITKKYFERQKKKALSNVIFSLESHNNINDSIVDSIIDYGYPAQDIIEIINSLTFEEQEQILNDLKLDSISTVIARKL